MRITNGLRVLSVTGGLGELTEGKQKTLGFVFFFFKLINLFECTATFICLADLNCGMWDLGP